MSKPSGIGQEYDVLLVDGDIRDEMAPCVCFRLVSREEVDALLSLTERQPDIELTIRHAIHREGQT